MHQVQPLVAAGSVSTAGLPNPLGYTRFVLMWTNNGTSAAASASARVPWTFTPSKSVLVRNGAAGQRPAADAGTSS